MKNNNLITLHKGNSLIRSKSAKYSIEQLKLLNTIYSLIQLNLEKVKNNNNEIEISFDEILRIVVGDDIKNIPKSKYSVLSEDNRKVLLESLTLKDFTDSKGEKWEWIDINLFEYIGVKKINNQKKKLSIKISSQLIYLIESSQNFFFTKLELKMMNSKLKSNFQYRFYEYLRSFENMKQKYINLDMDEYNLIFEKHESPYKQLSKIKEKIDRALKIINESTDLKVEIIVNKKQKFFTFNFLNKSSLENNLESNEKRINSILIKEEIKEKDMIESLLTK